MSKKEEKKILCSEKLGGGKIMKKIITIALAITTSMMLLSGCGDEYKNSNSVSTNSKATTQASVEKQTEKTIEVSTTAVPITTEAPKHDSIIYKGSGDSVVNVDYPDYLCVLKICGNQESRYFSVTAYDKDGKTDLLVNTTDIYEGIKYTTKNIKTLEIKATGDWKIEIMDAYQNCRYIKNGEAISGNSDDVLLFDGKCSTAEIKGNSDSRYFSVTSLNNIGRYDLLVNTTDVYSGTVMVKNEPFYLKLLHVATGPLH